jgi:hypothetical protein
MKANTTHGNQRRPTRTRGSQRRPAKANEDPRKPYRDQTTADVVWHPDIFFFVLFSSFFQLINIFVYFPANEDPTKAKKDPWQPAQANTGSRKPMQAIEYLNGVFSFSFSMTPTSPQSFRILFTILHERHHKCSHPFTFCIFCFVVIIVGSRNIFFLRNP